MNRLILPLLILFLLSGTWLYAQKQSYTPEDNPLIITDTRCGTVEHHDWLKTQYPDEFAQNDEFEAWLREAMVQMKAERSPQMPVATIPIIFHVVHNNGPDNLAATYINAQIEQLNFDYRKTPGTSGDNSNPVGADTEIEFCPAAVDPNGNVLAEPGINRILASSAGLTNPPYDPNYIENTIKPGTIWDPEQYFNVWVMNLDYLILGYAQLPSNSTLPGLGGGAANTDGCVILYSTVGSTTTPYPTGGPYAAGRTLTHEAGHWLGLVHIWGDSFCGDDYCADTPQSQGPNSGCPNLTTCDGIQDMVENYMDYSDDACFNIFTFDQKDRMATVLMNSPRRVNLLTSTVCNVNGCDLTATTTGTDQSCALADGTATVSATGGTAPYNYQWSIGAGSQTTATAIGLSAGAYTVTVTDSGNPQCTQVANVTVAGTPNTVTVMMTSSTPESCVGQDGTATAAGAGGSAPYSYMWDNGQMMATATGLAAGTYTVIITDANACSATAQVLVGDACAIGCDSISNYDFDLYTAALFAVPAPDAGLLSGTNTLGDQAYADYYVYPGANSTIKGAYFYFEGLDIANPATSSVDVTIWDAVAGAPGSVLGVAPVLMQDIQTFLDDATANMTSPLYWVEFNPYVALPANQEFFIGMQVPTTAGDTIGIVTSTVDFVQNPPVADAPSPGTGYIQDATGAWNTYETVWSFPFTHLIVPVLGTEPTAAFTPNQPTTICTGDMITFTNESTDATDYEWVIQGGTPSSATTEDVTVTYDTEGVFGVALIATNDCISDTITILDMVEVEVCTGCTIAATANVIDISCNGLCDGAIDLIVTGGTPPYTYTWSDGSTVEDPTGLCAGTYTVTVVDATGNCQTTAFATITEPTPIVATTSATPETCAGNDGTATATATGGTGALTYQWDDAGSQTTMTATGLTAGFYTVTITDANGCITITEAEVADACGNCVLTASTTGEDILCQLITLCSGSATAIPNNGIAPYTYQWDANTFSQTTETATGLCAGTYSVTVTDVAGCTATAEQTILDIPGITDLTVDSAPESCPNVCDGQAAAVVIGGTMPYTYLWDNGNTTAFQNNLCAGTYTITVTDANGCSLAQSVIVEGTSPIMQGSTLVNPTSCLGGDGSIDATFFGGTPPYQCSIDGGVNFVSGGSFGGLDAGIYILNCIDANACVADPITIEVEDGCICTVAGTITTTDATCGAASGTATATGTGGAAPYTYSWDTGGTTQTITGLAPGTYTVSVLDALGCDDIATATINDSGVLAVALEATDLTCNGDNNGSASVTTAGSFNYLWNTGSTASTINGLTGGNYTVTVTQGTCTDIQSIVVNEPAALNVNVQTQDSPCSANNGSATAIASGGTPPFSYIWNTGDTGPTISGLSSGSYTVTVVDANNCSTVSGGTLTSQNSGPVVTLNTGSQTSISCNGNSDGMVNINVGGGTTPLNYSWSNGASTEDLSNVPADTYTVIVTDANGCIGVLTVVVSEPSPMSLTYNTMPSSGNDGTASVNVSGGTPPYSYQWSDGQTGQTATGLAPGTYTVAITDANGCTINGSVSVEQYTGTYDLENLTNFELYPNPSTGEFTIALDFAEFEKADIFVYNTLGQGVAALYREGATLKIPMNISGQAAGTYFVVIQTDKGKAVKKFSLIR